MTGAGDAQAGFPAAVVGPVTVDRVQVDREDPGPGGADPMDRPHVFWEVAGPGVPSRRRRRHPAQKGSGPRHPLLGPDVMCRFSTRFGLRVQRADADTHRASKGRKPGFCEGVVLRVTADENRQASVRMSTTYEERKAGLFSSSECQGARGGRTAPSESR